MFIDPDGMRVSLFDRMEAQGAYFGKTAEEASAEYEEENGNGEGDNGGGCDDCTYCRDKLKLVIYQGGKEKEFSQGKEKV